jgi:thioesterase domain-containing protein/acyl carrier protein
MRRQGLPPLTAEKALALFDAALSTGRPVHVPVEIDQTALGARDAVPALLADLARAAGRRRRPSSSSAGALRRKLAQLSAPEQEQQLLSLILEVAAMLLGHDSAAGVDPERDFLESGFDSLAAMELRNTLNAATGLNLPAIAIFDHKTPAALARYLRAELGASAAVASAPAAEDDSLYGMYRVAVATGQAGKGFALLMAAAALRPEFHSAGELERLAVPARLAEGPARPRIICINPPMATGGAHQYARIASHLRTARDVCALSPMGFSTGDPLPATPTAALEALARCVLEAAQGDPFVLLGYSSGGLMSALVAEHMEAVGGPVPAGVVMLDTYKVHDGGDGGPLQKLAEGMVSQESTFGRFDNARLSGMGWYVRLLREMVPGSFAAPALFIQCTEPFFEESPGDAEWRAAPWDPAHTVVPVASNHFTMLEQGSAETAAALEGWLESQLGG